MLGMVFESKIKYIWKGIPFLEGTKYLRIKKKIFFLKESARNPYSPNATPYLPEI